jgi:hypothetical protein
LFFLKYFFFFFFFFFFFEKAEAKLAKEKETRAASEELEGSVVIELRFIEFRPYH